MFSIGINCISTDLQGFVSVYTCCDRNTAGFHTSLMCLKLLNPKYDNNVQFHLLIAALSGYTTIFETVVHIPCKYY
jgi:hypothetical protein